MPWRLIGIIAVMAFLLIFIGFNTENICDLSLGFVTFYKVPVYLTVFVSFGLGILFSLPFFFIGKKPKKEESTVEKEKPSGIKEKFAGRVGKPSEIKEEPVRTRKKIFGARKKLPDSADEGGPYGID